MRKILKMKTTSLRSQYSARTYTTKVVFFTGLLENLDLIHSNGKWKLKSWKAELTSHDSIFGHFPPQAMQGLTDVKIFTTREVTTNY